MYQNRDWEYFVWDARTDYIQGPYEQKEAEKFADTLNKRVAQTTFPVLADLAETITGPFYARHPSKLPEKVRKVIGR